MTAFSVSTTNILKGYSHMSSEIEFIKLVEYIVSLIPLVK